MQCLMRLNSDIVLDSLTRREDSHVLFTKGMPADVKNDKIIKMQYLQLMVVCVFAKTVQTFICNGVLYYEW